MAVKYLTVTHRSSEILPGLSLKQIKSFFRRIRIDPDVHFKGVPCWIWTGYTVHEYALVGINRGTELLHRVMYAWLVEPVPKGHSDGVLDHLCRRTLCVNPVHLELVTQRVNFLRGQSPAAKGAMRTHCAKGHPLSGDNLKVEHQHRICRICRRDYCRNQYIRYRQAAGKATPRISQGLSIHAEITFRGHTKTRNEWASLVGLSPEAFRARLRRGRTVEELLSAISAL